MFENELLGDSQPTAGIHTFPEDKVAGLEADEAKRPLDSRFEAQLSLAVDQAVKTGESVSLQIISLETPGTSSSFPIEIFMMEAGRRIDELIRGFDAATYLGEGKFGVLLRAVSGRKGVAFLATSILNGLEEPFSAGRQMLSLDVNIGFSLHETGVCYDELLARAEYALQKAQGSSGGLQCYETVG